MIEIVIYWRYPSLMWGHKGGIFILVILILTGCKAGVGSSTLSPGSSDGAAQGGSSGGSGATAAGSPYQLKGTVSQ